MCCLQFFRIETAWSPRHSPSKQRKVERPKRERNYTNQQSRVGPMQNMQAIGWSENRLLARMENEKKTSDSETIGDPKAFSQAGNSRTFQHFFLTHYETKGGRKWVVKDTLTGSFPSLSHLSPPSLFLSLGPNFPGTGYATRPAFLLCAVAFQRRRAWYNEHSA